MAAAELTYFSVLSFFFFDKPSVMIVLQGSLYMTIQLLVILAFKMFSNKQRMVCLFTI